MPRFLNVIKAGNGSGNTPLITPETSNGLVTNLNADLLDDKHGDYYRAFNGSTGITDTSGLLAVDSTHFNVGDTTGYIIDNYPDPENPTITFIDYEGSINNTTPYLLTDGQTEVFIDKTGSLVLNSDINAGAQHSREMLYLGKVIHPNGIIVAVENLPEIKVDANAQLRDLWRAIGIINENNYVYPNDANLQLALHGGRLHYNGLNFINNKLSPTALEIDSATPASFLYRTQNGTTYDTSNLVDATYIDLAGVRSTLNNNKFSNQRVFLTRSGLIRIQYGQKEYADMTSALNGISNETFVVSETLKYNSTLIGILSLKKEVASLSNTTDARFTGVSKFGEVGGGGGAVGGTANATDVAVADTAGYYTGTNVETVLAEIGSSLSNINGTELSAGTGIDVSSNVVGNLITWTVTHEDTSTLTGQQGTAGVSSITVDGLGHVTAVGTATYLTSSSQSKDFGNIEVSTTDSGYTWSATGTAVADANADTLKLISGTGIKLEVDANNDAVKVTSLITQYSHPVMTAQVSDNSNGVVIQDLTFDTLGHITTDGISTVDLDGRYYTETEVDTILEDYQPLDSDLTAIASITDTTGLLRKTDTDTWELDTTDYIDSSELSSAISGKMDTDGSNSNIDILTFDTTPSSTPLLEGQMRYNPVDKTWDAATADGQVYQLGQEQAPMCINNTTTTMVSGQIVRITGSVGAIISVELARANNEGNSSATFGMVTQTIPPGQAGKVTINGVVHELDTMQFAEGATLWLDPTIAGQVTVTKPLAPNHSVLIGWVKKTHLTEGEIYVHPSNGFELDELHDVYLNTLSNGQVLKYNSSTGVWNNSTLTNTDVGAAPTVHNHDTLYYTKSEIDTKVSAVYKYKGSVASYANLPTSNQVVGDVWNVLDTGDNYAWDGTGWDDIGGTVPMASGTTNGLLSSSDFTKLSGIESGAQVNNISNLNATDLTDGGSTSLHNHDTMYYTESEVNTKLSEQQAFAIAMSIALS